MKHPLPFATVALALCAPTMGQGLLEVSCFQGNGVPIPPANVWTTSTTTDVAVVAMRFDQHADPDEYTLLLAHTTIDPDVAGVTTTRGILATYPYFEYSTAWRGDNSAFGGASFTIDNAATTTLGIPPWRVRAQLDRYLSETNPHPSYGVSFTSSTAPVLLNVWSSWPTNLLPYDERKAWQGTSWLVGDLVPAGSPPCMFNVASLGRSVAIQQANGYAALTNITLDPAALEELNGMLDNTLGFKVMVQAVHVRHPATGGPRVRFSQVNTLRRRSMSQQSQWTTYFGGAERWIPALVNADVRVYLAPRGGEMHINFPNAVSLLTAWIITSSGTMQVPQIPNPVLPDTGSGMIQLDPTIARFTVPVSAGNQVVFFTDGNGQPVVPWKAYAGGALISAFDNP